MNIEEILKRLKELQLEQTKLIDQLNEVYNINDDSLEGNNDSTAKLKQPTGLGRDTISIGDVVTVKTSGIKCKVGDTATVTRVNKKTVNIRVNRNGYHTHRKFSNVDKAQVNNQK